MKWPEPQQSQEKKLQGARPLGRAWGDQTPAPRLEEVTALLPPPTGTGAADGQSPRVTMQWGADQKALGGGPWRRAEALAI